MQVNKEFFYFLIIIKKPNNLKALVFINYSKNSIIMQSSNFIFFNIVSKKCNK